MACAANYAFSDPREQGALGMNGGVALTRTHIAEGALAVASLDEDAAFSMVQTPPWLWPWLAAPPIRASLVRESIPQILKAKNSRNSLVAAEYKHLPMGLAHSVYIPLCASTRS